MLANTCSTFNNQWAYFSITSNLGGTTYVWLNRLPRVPFYILVVLFLPVIGLVDGIGYLTGLIKVGPRDTWNDEVLRIVHNARNIEIGVGLMSLSYIVSGFTTVYLFPLLLILPQGSPIWPIGIMVGVYVVYTIFVYWWAAKHRVDPINGVRDFGIDG